MRALFALSSAIFAALTSILATIGVDGVNSNFAAAIRTVVVLIMTWGMVFIAGGPSGITLVLAFLFLHEQFTFKSAIGTILITAGTLIMVL